MIRIKNNVTPRLPNEYQELDYIESTGTQYIDTNYIINANTKIEDWITGNIDNASLNGSDGPASSTSKFRFKYGFNLGNWAIGYADKWLSIYKTSKPIDTNTFYKFTIGKGIQKIEPDIFSYEYNYELGAYPTRTMLLFALREDTNKIMYATNLKRKECKIYENNVLIRDFIPCYRKIDNVVGLYDLANNQFYTNAGTGVFLMGTEVNKADMNLVPMICNKKVSKRLIGENLVHQASDENNT